MNVNVAEVEPAGIVTVAGTVPAAVLPEVRATTNPPVGAALVIVTVPVEAVPPVTAVGLNVSPERVGAVSARAAEALVPFTEAEMLAVAFAPTATVVTVKVAVVVPAATVTEAGTVAAALSDARLTVKPPTGALPVRVTVAVEGLPPTKDVGFNASD